MQGGDISNREASRVYFVWEGLVAFLPTDEVLYGGGRMSQRRLRQMQHVRDSSTFNVTLGRVWVDIHWRLDIRCTVVSFIFGDSMEWQEMLQAQLDQRDLPVTARAYDLQEFLSTVLVAPSCAGVYCPTPQSALTFGGKGMAVDPHHTFTLR